MKLWRIKRYQDKWWLLKNNELFTSSYNIKDLWFVIESYYIWEGKLP